MVAMTALQQAEEFRKTFVKWSFGDQQRQEKIDAAIALAEWRVFANVDIAHITKLGVEEVARLDLPRPTRINNKIRMAWLRQEAKRVNSK